ncbi:MAG: DUF790 family protein, partial [Lentisphaeria bacterium]|nr:DUF790 family protein [Lentisphaeria bacterium]
MLTKDLLRFRIIKGTVKPQFVDTGNATLLQLAEELLTIYRQPGVSRAEIADVVEPALNCIKDRKLACG